MTGSTVGSSRSASRSRNPTHDQRLRSQICFLRRFLSELVTYLRHDPKYSRQQPLVEAADALTAQRDAQHI